jgi:DME family drug/metabolite transporter
MGTTATFAERVSPLGIGAATTGLGGILLALTAINSIVESWGRIAGQWPTLALGAISVGVYPLAFYSSMHLPGVAVGTVISIGSAPLVAALIKRMFDGHKLTARWYLGAIIGLTGVALLAFAEAAPDAHASATDGANVCVGILLSLVAGLTCALYSWAARCMMQVGAHSRAAMGSIFGVGGLFLLPDGAPFLTSWTDIGVAMYMVLIPVVLAYALFGFGLARISATTARTLSLLEPVISAVLAVVILGERLQMEGWAGIRLIVGCLVVLTTSSSAKQVSAAAAEEI